MPFRGMSALPDSFRHIDEYYQIKDFSRSIAHVLLRLDASYLDMNMPLVHHKDADFPLAWAKTYGKGRVYYSALGHDPSNWDERAVQEIYFEAMLRCMPLRPPCVAKEFCPHCFGNDLRDLFLDSKGVACPAVDQVRPQDAAAQDVRDLCRDAKHLLWFTDTAADDHGCAGQCSIHGPVYDDDGADHGEYVDDFPGDAAAETHFIAGRAAVSKTCTAMVFRLTRAVVSGRLGAALSSLRKVGAYPPLDSSMMNSSDCPSLW